MKKNYFTSFKKGLKGYVKAIKFISQNKLSYFYLFPLLLNLFLFVIGIRIIDFLSDQINEYVINLLNYNFESLSLWRSFLNSVIYWAIWVVTKIVYMWYPNFLAHLIEWSIFILFEVQKMATEPL